MDLDELHAMIEIDALSWYEQLTTLPDEMENAWLIGNRLPLPDLVEITRVVLVGMGDCGVAADLAAAVGMKSSRIPIEVYHEGILPYWVRGKNCLLIALSSSDDTGDILVAVKTAKARNVNCLVITSKNSPEYSEEESKLLLWRYQRLHNSGPSYGFMFALVMAVINRLGMVIDPDQELTQGIEELYVQQARLHREIPAATNPAKRIAGQMVGRIVTVVGSGFLSPVARCWANQINLIAKSRANFAYLPEIEHNFIAGIEQPEQAFQNTLTLFLRGANQPSNQRLRNDLTRKLFMLQGLPTDFVDAPGKNEITNMLTCLQLGDYVAYYLAVAYGLDPAPSPVIDALSEELRLSKKDPSDF